MNISDIEKILENQNISEETTDMITQKYPPLSDEQKKRILSRVNMMDTKETNEKQIRVISERRKKPVLQIAACAAAFLVIAGAAIKIQMNSSHPGSVPVSSDVTESAEITEPAEETEISDEIIYPEIVPAEDGTFILPDFTGLDYETVKQKYKDYLDFEIDEMVYSEKPSGIILNQDNKAFRVEQGFKIYLIISKGEKNNEIPSVDSGFTEEQARGLLEDSGFKVQTRLKYSDTVPEGCVINSEPSDLTELTEGSEVILNVSRGSMSAFVILPDVKGMNYNDAMKVLEDIDLVCVIQMTNSDAPEGTVSGMSYSANSRVETGTLITLFVSTGFPPVYSQELEIHFPENADGIFTFKMYSDGVLKAERDDVNAGYTGRTNLELNSNGQHEITVVLVNQENGLESELGRYLIDFDETGKKETISEDIAEAFRAVEGIKAD